MGRPPHAPPGRFCCCFSPLLLARGALLLQNQGLSPRFIVASPFQTFLFLDASSSGGRWSCGHAVQMLNEISVPPRDSHPPTAPARPPTSPLVPALVPAPPELGSGSLVPINIHFSSAPALPASPSHLPTRKSKSISPSPPPHEGLMWFQDDSAAVRHRPCPLSPHEQDAGGGLGCAAHEGFFGHPQPTHSSCQQSPASPAPAASVVCWHRVTKPSCPRPHVPKPLLLQGHPAAGDEFKPRPRAPRCWEGAELPKTLSTRRLGTARQGCRDLKLGKAANCNAAPRGGQRFPALRLLKADFVLPPLPCCSPSA